MSEGTQGVVNKELREKIAELQKEINTIRQVLKQNSHNLRDVSLLDEKGDE